MVSAAATVSTAIIGARLVRIGCELPASANAVKETMPLGQWLRASESPWVAGAVDHGSSGHVVRRALLIAVVVLLAGGDCALAQRFPLESLPERPIRLEGYWDRTRDDRDVIGDLVVSTNGRAKRRFGVTAVQAYKPEEEGMQLFRFTSDHPVTLLVRGDDETVRRFFEAPSDRKVIAFGTYNRGSGTFVLGSVDVGERRKDARR
jgi:hypothetical protein